MRFRNALFFILIAILIPGGIFAQQGETPLRLFGYFQNQFKQEGNPVESRESNTFVLQQLNVFFQKNLSTHWSAFVNFEALNSFSVSRNTGALNLEEAWVKYRLNKNFNLRLGLQIPTFNHLNRIKNRTPVLPYIIRPLIYEASLSEVIPVDEFTPSSAFLEAYGLFSAGEMKFEYAFSFGNSPNIRTVDDRGQSGVDSTSTFLVGGRLGMLFKGLKFGVSATYDKVNRFADLADRFPVAANTFNELPRLRLGADLLYRAGPVFLQGEVIQLDYENKTQFANFDKTFFYGTFGVKPKEKLQCYLSVWRTRVNSVRPASNTQNGELVNFVDKTTSPSFGLAYNFLDRLVGKAQFTRFSRERTTQRVGAAPGFNIYSLAVSVMF